MFNVLSYYVIVYIKIKDINATTEQFFFSWTHSIYISVFLTINTIKMKKIVSLVIKKEINLTAQQMELI